MPTELLKAAMLAFFMFVYTATLAIHYGFIDDSSLGSIWQSPRLFTLALVALWFIAWIVAEMSNPYHTYLAVLAGVGVAYLLAWFLGGFSRESGHD